ncbi:sugar transferase, partial [Vibrio xuii]
NVLKGDMSLVGPRPNVPAQREEYDKLQWEKRNSVLPGITGLAQATLRSKATWQERFELDIEYVNKSSLHYDFYIILLTFKQVFFKGGN